MIFESDLFENVSDERLGKILRKVISKMEISNELLLNEIERRKVYYNPEGYEISYSEIRDISMKALAMRRF
ncbi:MAG: hypothetical protein Q9M91_05985 [Candidatus Dojkabacteria bacterium]|nr:hypothetical protein [Candidatus Dojkabacteria bacterium]MDQ7021349.1 hypothetical protein [Candidatus Dojkabacteria bacterium]